MSRRNGNVVEKRTNNNDSGKELTFNMYFKKRYTLVPILELRNFDYSF